MIVNMNVRVHTISFGSISVVRRN